MGRPMAERLLKASYSLTVWNRTRVKAEVLAPFNAHIVSQPDEAVEHADIVITMLEAGPVVAQVLDAVLAAMRPGTLVIDMSSTKQSEAEDVHQKLKAHGVGFIDAPVSGGVLGAEAGTLAIMVGGSVESFARAEPLLKTMGRPTLIGPVGCGQVAKMCNQLIVGGTIAIVAEALLLAHSCGADPAAVRAAIRGGFAESRILEVHGQRMLERDFVPGGQVRSQAKDLENVLDAASHAGLLLPVAELVTQSYLGILDTFPNADQAAALLGLEKLNPGRRLGADEDRLP